MESLKNKTILVTGASSGIGRQTAITLSHKGASLVLTGRNTNRLQETIHLLSGSNHSIICCDMKNPEEIEALALNMPDLNGLVFSTGVSHLCAAAFIQENDIFENFSVGFNSAVLLCLIRLKKLIKQNCSLVFVSSISTSYPYAGGAMYISTKAALEAWSKVLAIELEPKGIRVNCIAPAFVSGEIHNKLKKETSKDIVEKTVQKQMLGLGSPQDVAALAAFLLSDEARWITGSRITMGGG